MTGLPKKYARMGFKAGWRAYKALRSSGGTTMAKRKFRTRVVRAARRAFRSVKRRAYSGGGLTKGWIPLSTREMMVDFGVGLTVVKVNSLVSGFTDPIIGGFAGSYTGELRTAIVGALAYKMGSGIIREAGREYFRFAVMSAGAQTAANNNLFNVTTQLVPDVY